MIEGLRLIPWFYDELRRDPDGMKALSSCAGCMKANHETTRREMGCGFLPPLSPRRRLPVWRPSALAYAGDQQPSENEDVLLARATCAGYLVRLPQVVEVARAHNHWHKGELATFCGRDAPSELLLMSVEILAGSVSDLNLALMTPASKGGLGSN